MCVCVKRFRLLPSEVPVDVESALRGCSGHPVEGVGRYLSQALRSKHDVLEHSTALYLPTLPVFDEENGSKQAGFGGVAFAQPQWSLFGRTLDLNLRMDITAIACRSQRQFGRIC